MELCGEHLEVGKLYTMVSCVSPKLLSLYCSDTILSPGRMLPALKRSHRGGLCPALLRAALLQTVLNVTWQPALLPADVASHN